LVQRFHLHLTGIDDDDPTLAAAVLQTLSRRSGIAEELSQLPPRLPCLLSACWRLGQARLLIEGSYTYSRLPQRKCGFSGMAQRVRCDPKCSIPIVEHYAVN